MIKELDKRYLKGLVKLDKLAFKPLAKRLGKYSGKGVKEYFELTLKKGKLFGYFINEKLIACVGIVINRKFKYGEVEHLLVNPNFQKKEVAKELMKFIENYAIKMQLKGLRLNVRCKNNNAIGFYEHSGYIKHAYIMAKELR